MIAGFATGNDRTTFAAITGSQWILAKVPKGLDLIQTAALPLVTTTGNQLISLAGIKAGQTVLIVGATNFAR